jgi:hypothetical protein
MTTTTEASTEAQVIRANTAEALKLAARATDLSLVGVDVNAYHVTLSFRHNADAATFAERIGAHVDAEQNAAGDEKGSARWWTTDDGWWALNSGPRMQIVGWGEGQ